jgi:threonine dehydrogenase-like Zn-dependent dehydrogenase
MKALVFERNLPRFAASRLASGIGGSGKGTALSPLRLVDLEPPELPGPGWHRVRPILSGICGSDLATVDGRSSRYFEPLVSFPFVPGHEILGVVEQSHDLEREPSSGQQGGEGDGHSPRRIGVGSRVVVESVIGCVPRAIRPLCPACAEGRIGGCEHVAFGDISPGLQIGYCADTGGGWSTAGLVAHETQLHAVPESMADEDAVMVEPTACAVHAAMCARVVPGDTVAVLGAGTVGLTVVAAVRELAEPGAIFTGAKHAHQRRLAEELGADQAVPPDQLGRVVRRRSRSLALSERASQLTGGADVVLDCVGSAQSLTESLSIVRPRGRVVLVGMPGSVRVDLASLWHREVELTGSYAYGVEELNGTHRNTFELAMEVVAARGIGRLVSSRYSIDRFEEAMEHAGAAGRRSAVKIVFDLGQSRSGRSHEPRRQRHRALAADGGRRP